MIRYFSQNSEKLLKYQDNYFGIGLKTMFQKSTEFRYKIAKKYGCILIDSTTLTHDFDVFTNPIIKILEPRSKSLLF